MPKVNKAAPGGDFILGEIDEIIHGRVRLGVVAHLIAAGEADFNTLKAKTETTDGTLSVHIRKLADAGYVQVRKGYHANRPITRLSMTTKGRKAFQAYLETIGRLAELGD